MSWPREEDVVVAYHRALEFIAKVEMLDDDQMEQLIFRFAESEGSHDGDDKIALRLLGKIVETYRYASPAS
jgi:hypothetical protein